MYLYRALLFTFGVFAWRFFVKAQVEDKTVLRILSVLDYWNDAFKNQSSPEFIGKEDEYRRTFVTHSLDPLVRTAVIKFRFLRISRQSNTTFVEGAFILRRSVIRRVFSTMLLDIPVLNPVVLWINDAGAYPLDDSVTTLYSSIMFHPEPVLHRILGCWGNVYVNNTLLSWSSYFGYKTSPRWLEIQQLLEASIRPRLKYTEIYGAYVKTDLVECRPKLSRTSPVFLYTYCMVAVYIDQEKLLDDKIDYANPEAYEQIKHMLQRYDATSVLSGFREVEVEELRSPLDSIVTDVRMGGHYKKNHAFVPWDPSYFARTNLTYFHAIAHIHQLMDYALLRCFPRSAHYDIVDVSFVERYDRVYILMKVLFNTKQISRFFANKYLNANPRLINLINSCVRVHARELMHRVEPAY